MEFNVGRKFTSCKGCTKRELGCHSHCKDYLEQKAKRDKINEERRKYNDEEADFLRVRNNRRNKRR